MILFRFKFNDERGALARVMGALGDAGINIERNRFDANEERHGLSKQRVGRGIIVVRDEDRDMTLKNFSTLAKSNPKLGLKNPEMYYDITIALDNTPGAFSAELGKLAKLDVNIRHNKTKGTNKEGKLLENLVLECSAEQYNLAKQALGRIIQDESPFDPNIIPDSM